MSLIYIIRHGQASFGKENYDCLSDIGVRQSELLGDYFKSTGVTFDTIYSGSLERQIATFRAVTARMPSNQLPDKPIILQEFNEVDSFSDLMKMVATLAAEDPEVSMAVESMNTDPHALKNIYGKVVQRWGATKSLNDFIISWKDVGTRVQAGLDQIRAENGSNKRVAVFTSGGPIAATLQIALDLDDTYAFNLPRHIRNTAVSTFLYDDKRLSLYTYNSIAHLEIHNNPALITFI
jgi:broad specificity phosphatase PhoE